MKYFKALTSLEKDQARNFLEKIMSGAEFRRFLKGKSRVEFRELLECMSGDHFSELLAGSLSIVEIEEKFNEHRQENNFFISIKKNGSLPVLCEQRDFVIEKLLLLDGMFFWEPYSDEQIAIIGFIDVNLKDNKRIFHARGIIREYLYLNEKFNGYNKKLIETYLYYQSSLGMLAHVIYCIQLAKKIERVDASSSHLLENFKDPISLEAITIPVRLKDAHPSLPADDLFSLLLIKLKRDGYKVHPCSRENFKDLDIIVDRKSLGRLKEKVDMGMEQLLPTPFKEWLAEWGKLCIALQSSAVVEDKKREQQCHAFLEQFKSLIFAVGMKVLDAKQEELSQGVAKICFQQHEDYAVLCYRFKKVKVTVEFVFKKYPLLYELLTEKMVVNPGREAGVFSDSKPDIKLYSRQTLDLLRAINLYKSESKMLKAFKQIVINFEKTGNIQAASAEFKKYEDDWTSFTKIALQLDTSKEKAVYDAVQEWKTKHLSAVEDYSTPTAAALGHG